MLHKAESKVSKFNLPMLQINYSADVFRCTRLGLFCVNRKKQRILLSGVTMPSV